MLLLIMMLTTGLTALAGNITFNWNIAGGGRVGTTIKNAGTLSEPGVTTFTTEFKTGWIYFIAAPGYKIVSLEGPAGMTANDKKILQNANIEDGSGSYWGKFINSSMLTNWGENPVLNFTLEEIERSSSVNINVVNGAQYIEAAFASGYKPTLSDGANTVNYDPVFDGAFTLTPVYGTPFPDGQKTFYSVTLNGTAQSTPATYYNYFKFDPLVAGSNIEVTVFEGGAPVLEEYTVTVKLAEGLEDCIKSIRDWTTSKFVDLVDNTLTVKGETDIAFNFNEDYDFTDITFAGENIPFNTEYNNIRFTIDKSGELVINGAPKVYGTVPFTGYIQNVEGVILRAETYMGNAIDITGGEDVTADVALDGYTLQAASSKKYTFDISAKNPNIYVAPKEGWIIRTVQAKPTGEKLGPVQYLTADDGTTTFYVIAEKAVKNGKVNFEVSGSKAPLKLQPNQQTSTLWDNPEHTFTLSEGSNSFSFIPGYDNPFTLRTIGEVTGFQVSLDGLYLSPDDYGIYTINPVVPAAGEEAAQASTVKVNDTGAARPATTVKFKATGVTAECLYGPLRKTAAASGSYESGIEFVVKPATSSCTVVSTYKVSENGSTVTKTEVLHGMKPGSAYVNGLNAAGEVVYTLPAGATTVELAVTSLPALEIAGVAPASGSTVKTISTIKVTVPTNGDGETEISTTPELVKGITLTDAEGNKTAATALGEVSMNNEGNAFIFPIEFTPALTAAGKYTLEIPAGTFYEAKWDDTAEASVYFDGGKVSTLFTADYTLDPNAVAKIDSYTLDPPAGSAIKTLDRIILTFGNYKNTDMIQTDYMQEVTMISGEKTVSCYASRYYGEAPTCQFSIEPDEALTDGDWILQIPEGYFTFEDEKSPVITAEYNIDESNPVYSILPAPNKKVNDLSHFTITFSGVSEVEYNDYSVTLSGANFESSTMEVTGVPGSNVFEIQFGSYPNKEGQYELSIPAGAFTLDGEPSEAVSALYTFKPAWELTPAPGSTVESLNEIIISFPEAKEVTFEGTQHSFMLTNGGSYAAPGFLCEKVADAAVPTFKLTMPADAQEPPLGSLTFFIDEGAFNVDGVPSAQIAVGYVLDHEIGTLYTPTPEKYLQISEWGLQWAFLFDEAAVVSVKKQSGIHVYLNGEEQTGWQAMGENNMLLMMMDATSDMKDDDVLKVVAEAGAVSLSGTDAPELSYEWILYTPKEYTAVVTPDASQTVNSLKELTISFPEATTGELFEANLITLQDTKYTYTKNPTVTAVEGAEHPKFKLTFDPEPTTSGNYRLMLNDGAFVLDEKYASSYMNTNYTLVYTTSVDLIGIDSDSNVTVVSLDGKVLYKDVPAREVRGLERGIYIVNGKKVLVK